MVATETRRATGLPCIWQNVGSMASRISCYVLYVVKQSRWGDRWIGPKSLAHLGFSFFSATLSLPTLALESLTRAWFRSKVGAPLQGVGRGETGIRWVILIGSGPGGKLLWVILPWTCMHAGVVSLIFDCACLASLIY